MRGLYIAQQCINNIREDSKLLLQHEMSSECERLRQKLRKDRKNLKKLVGEQADSEED